MSQCFQFEPHPVTRRELLRRSSVGFGAVALSALLGDAARGERVSPLDERPPHFAPRAKRVIFLFPHVGTLADDLCEFGRTPTEQGNKDGRDHNPHAISTFLAGGGVRGGLRYGRTDDYGYYAVEDKVHFHDLHATILHLLGLDHERLTYRWGGRDFRLTDVHGRVVEDIVEDIIA